MTAFFLIALAFFIIYLLYVIYQEIVFNEGYCIGCDERYYFKGTDGKNDIYGCLECGITVKRKINK